MKIGVRGRLRQLLGYVEAQVARRRVLRGRTGTPALPHDLPGRLVVSLTSFPARFADLHLTIRSLLRQSVRPDRVILWISPSYRPQLTRELLELAEQELLIMDHEDIGPATKLVPALKAFPDDFIVTADDDLYYPPDWLSVLVSRHDQARPAVVARRAHIVKTDPAGLCMPYRQWERDTDRLASTGPGEYLFPTGVGGVLYPPGCFDPRVLDEANLARLCANADDVWFFWMARLAGCRQIRTPGEFRIINWPGSQKIGLHHGNVGNLGNDAQIAAMENAYGALAGLTATAL